MNEVEQQRLRWEARFPHGRKGQKPVPHPVPAAKFLEELKILAQQTGDARFSAALTAIADRNLVDEQGRWKRRTRRYWDSVIYELPEGVVRDVDRYRAEGNSIQLACARLAVDWDEPADSFDGLLKTIEKLYRSTKASGSEPKGGGAIPAPERSKAP